MNEQILSTLMNGVDDSLTTAAKNELEKSIRNLARDLENIQFNRTTNIKSNDGGFNGRSNSVQKSPRTLTDAEVYTNLSEMINGNNNDPGGFNSLLEALYAKNKKGYSILKDYELMPILIPQINRVLMFMVNECLSPDIQNNNTFVIKYLGGDSDPDRIQQDIDQIKAEMKLDNMLRDVYINRYKLGREYYAVIDYTKTFEHMLDRLNSKRMNEAASGGPLKTDYELLNEDFSFLTETVNDINCSVVINALAENDPSPGYRKDPSSLDIVESTVQLSFKNLNIRIERSSIAKRFEDAHAELISESYSRYRLDDMLDYMDQSVPLNEAITDSTKMEELVKSLQSKKIQRCTIERFDPAKIFKLKVGGKVIGYLHISDINEGSAMLVNFAQALKDQLLKSRATNLNAATANAEDVISRELAERIINKFDPHIGISRIEDIDLLHNFIKNNEIFRGNKRVTFYYEDEIYDMSRSDDSVLINGVFFTKLYATLLLNNIMTKILRGRGRQIHTIRMGASPDVQRYLQNAMAALTMPENNLGTLHGSFEQILNPFNSASDIVIPTEDDTDRYITTDYIPGQDVDMNEDFLRMILNSIVSTFNIDSAAIDATNGNIQFARTLSMESLQICNLVKNEQQDLYDAWKEMCFQVLRIMGTEATRTAVDQGKIQVEFYEPKSLILQNTIDDINNAKNYAEAIADIIPEFNQEDSEQKRSKFIYQIVKQKTNVDWSYVDTILDAVRIDTIPDKIENNIQQIVREYEQNTKEQQYGDTNGDGIVTDDDMHDEGDLTSEEEDLMGSSEDF